MPIYEYRCTNDHRFEVLQRFSDDPIEVCEVCGAPAVRVLHPVAIHFKGSGFYNTDYGKGKKKPSDSKSEGGGESKSSSDSSPSSGSSSGDSKKSDSSSSGDKKKAAEG
jgi:putative FmdB family regulatory protein